MRRCAIPELPCSWPAAAVQFDNVRTIAGAGVCGTLTSAGSVTDPGGAPGQTVAVGNRVMLDAVGASASDALHKLQEEAEERGRTALYVAEGGRAVGVITLEECITEDAKLAVRALRDAGLQMSVITGDRPAAAQRLHDELGIPVHASVSPEEKVQHVRDAQRSHGAVALVGDGINDAAAIAEADIGIARTSGAGVSIEAADIALYNPNLEVLADLHALARRTRRVIHQNLGGRSATMPSVWVWRSPDFCTPSSPSPSWPRAAPSSPGTPSGSENTVPVNKETHSPSDLPPGDKVK